jgi:hypothetical protein
VFQDKVLRRIRGMKMAGFWVVTPSDSTNPEDSHLHIRHRENLKSYED